MEQLQSSIGVGAPPPYVLTIAGSDPSGGAGLQRDLEVFRACQARGLSVTTVVTAQVSGEFKSLYVLPRKIIAAQLSILLRHIPIAAAKTGLLYKKGIIELLMNRLKKYPSLKLIVDPVMAASAGRTLLEPKALDSLKKLLGLALVVTPNLHEAGVLSGRAIRGLEGMKRAAKEIFKFGPQYVMVKGGHLETDPVDILYDGRDWAEFPKKRISGTSFHGLGCRFSAALAAFIARGLPVLEAVGQTEEWMQREMSAIVNS